MPCNLVDYYKYFATFWRNLLALLFYAEDGGKAFLKNTGNNLPEYTASHPTELLSSVILLHSSCNNLS
jgi:hypothetical protein